MNHTLTNGTVNEPAQVTYLKLPCRTPALEFHGALFPDPAGLLTFGVSIDPGD